MDPIIVQLIANLTEVSMRYSAAKISARISAINSYQDSQKAIDELQEIINTLIREHNEILAIAQGLKEQLVSQQIDDSDIKKIVETVIPALREMIEDDKGVSEAQQILSKVELLISTNTLKVLQTLGFNYIEAIGKPLTQITKNFLLSKLDSNHQELDLKMIQERNYGDFLALGQHDDWFERIEKMRELVKDIQPPQSS